MNKISIQEISEIVSKETNQTKKFSEQFLRELVSVIAEYLQKDGIVKVKGLGTFKLVAVEERKSVDVASGKEIILPAHNKIQFTAENSVKQEISGKGQELVDSGQGTVSTSEGRVQVNLAMPSEDETWLKRSFNKVDKGQDSNHQITESPDYQETTASQHHHNYWVWLILIIVLVDLAALAYVSVPYWKPYFDNLTGTDELTEEAEYHYVLPMDKENNYEAETVAEESGDTIEAENTEANEDVKAQEQTSGITLENYTYKDAMEAPVRETVTVIDGSRLTMIAYRAYGSKDFWVYVYDANRDVLRRPKDVAKGMTIKIADLPLSIVDPNNPACIEKAKELAEKY